MIDSVLVRVKCVYAYFGPEVRVHAFKAHFPDYYKETGLKNGYLFVISRLYYKSQAPKVCTTYGISA
jgi:hypothetical protein